MLDMEAIKNFSIDKSDWKKVKFGDVVFEPKESVKDPIAEGVEHVVGLEHIDSQEIQFERSGSTEGGTTFTKKFSKGDVLFGRRRAYLKKAAKANFAGICSGDITVMRTKKEKLIQDLLPFIVNNTKFFDYAIKHSAGGLSPRVKFKDLSTNEIDLPPLNIQEDLLELLSSAEKLHSENIKLKHYLEVNNKVFVTNKISDMSEKSPVFKLGDLVEFTTGKLDSNASVENGTYPFFTCAPTTLKIDQYSFDCEALLLAGNNASGVYPLKHYKGKFDAYQRTYVIQIKDSNSLMYSYLLEVLRNKLELLQRLSVGSSTKFLTIKVLKNLDVPVPLIDEQLDFVNKVSAYHQAISDSDCNCNSYKNLYEELKQKVF